MPSRAAAAIKDPLQPLALHSLSKASAMSDGRRAGAPLPYCPLSRPDQSSSRRARLCVATFKPTSCKPSCLHAIAWLLFWPQWTLSSPCSCMTHLEDGPGLSIYPGPRSPVLNSICYHRHYLRPPILSLVSWPIPHHNGLVYIISFPSLCTLLSWPSSDSFPVAALLGICGSVQHH